MKRITNKNRQILQIITITAIISLVTIQLVGCATRKTEESIITDDSIMNFRIDTNKYELAILDLMYSINGTTEEVENCLSTHSDIYTDNLKAMLRSSIIDMNYDDRTSEEENLDISEEVINTPIEEDAYEYDYYGEDSEWYVDEDSEDSDGEDEDTGEFSEDEDTGEFSEVISGNTDSESSDNTSEEFSNEGQISEFTQQEPTSTEPIKPIAPVVQNQESPYTENEQIQEVPQPYKISAEEQQEPPETKTITNESGDEVTLYGIYDEESGLYEYVTIEEYRTYMTIVNPLYTINSIDGYDGFLVANISTRLGTTMLLVCEIEGDRIDSYTINRWVVQR